MGFPDQETRPRRSPMPMATDSGTEAAADESRLSLSGTSSHMATGGGGCGASPPLVVVSARDVTKVSTKKEKARRRLRRRRHLWADVPADILGTVLGLLPFLADRASVRSVCRHWRAAARVLQILPAPLPVLVLPRFIRLSCLTSEGALTAARRALVPVEAAGDVAWIVGSSDDWLMAVRSSRHATGKAGVEYFLVHAFSTEVVHLPCLQQKACNYDCLDESKSARPIPRFFNGTKEREPWLLLFSAVLSASPSSGSNYIVAALSYNRAEGAIGLALWQPGMTSWYFCRSDQINSFSYDLALYQGKLYVVWWNKPDIFAFEIREDEHGVNLSFAEHYKINRLISSENTGSKKCNLVVWRGKLLLIIRFFSDYINMTMNSKPSAEVFALDFSTSPYVTQIHNFGGDCIFVQNSGCRSFSPGLHVGVQGDLIYFSDERIINHVSDTYVHNMRDGTLRRIVAGLPLANSGSGVPRESCLDFPVWIFPS